MAKDLSREGIVKKIGNTAVCDVKQIQGMVSNINIMNQTLRTIALLSENPKVKAMIENTLRVTGATV